MTTAQLIAKFGQPTDESDYGGDPELTRLQYDADDPRGDTYVLLANKDGKLFYGGIYENGGSQYYWAMGDFSSPDDLTGSGGNSLGGMSTDGDVTGLDVQSIHLGMTFDQVREKLGSPSENVHNPGGSNDTSISVEDVYKVADPAGGEYRIDYDSNDRVVYATSDFTAVNWTAGNTGSACPSFQLFAVRGSGQAWSDHQGYGEPLWSLYQALKSSAPSVGAAPIEYEAVNVEFGKLLVNPKLWKPSYDGDYMRSVNGGVDELRNRITDFVASPCGTSAYIYLAGYSQGAEVIDDLLQTLAAPLKQRLDGVVLLGDPRFSAAQAADVDQGSYSPTMSGIAPLQFSVYLPRHDGFGTLVSYDSSEAPLIHSYCVGHDPVCNQSTTTLVACVDVSHGLSSDCPHFRYAELPFAENQSYAQAAAAFLLGRWRTRTDQTTTTTTTTTTSTDTYTSHTQYGAGSQGSAQNSGASAATVTVNAAADPASSPTPTGLSVLKGQALTFSAEGSAKYGYDGPPCEGYPTTDADGYRSVNGALCPTKLDDGAPVPSAPIGALIARIGDGPWFAVHGSNPVYADGAGALYVAYNDLTASDNSGSYTVTAKVK